jgi:hypothetical protein
LIELFNLSKDQNESENLFRPQHPQVIQLRKVLVEARNSINQSVLGKDYPEESVLPQPPRIFWTDIPEYQKYFKEWKTRPEYQSRLRKL